MKQLGATVVGVSRDPVDSHVAFAKSLTIGFPLVSDEDKAISGLYGVGGIFSPGRVTFVIDEKRMIRAVFKSGSDVVSHVDGSLEALKALQPAS